MLFRSDDTSGCVLVSHVADPSIRRGDPFWKLLKLTPVDIATLRTALADGHTCWLVSALGVGFISARYDLWTGYFLYVHIHDHPPAVRRLLYRGRALSSVIQPSPLGGMRTTSVSDVKDEAVLKRLQPSLAYIDLAQMITDRQASEGFLSLDDIRSWIASVATFIDVHMKALSVVSEEAGLMGSDTVSCPAPRLVEGMILYWLCLFHRLFPDEEIRYTVSPYLYNGEAVLRATLDIITDEKQMKERLLGNELIFADINHMIYKGELCGVRITVTADELPVLIEAPKGTAPERRQRLTADLLFFKNPAKSPPSGLKNDPRFSYDDQQDAD